ncbi:hypothetical protein MGG_15571 [Pyricularia oryzae 70-15]|uniref:Uncharacterized protein n=1 Tax=Pyricularia oryzae (strain 70-15 / ATCC MYA-4617 / FGSC 8958) TaxID=242507 RepID=G4MTT4_PYRO7|nr:uncharacterized protein MGG_15571 [Pyricularia oryzae 70-15]EHA53923.1 hypothetical protein MGG_15571 [Pyricularia oryzae 70-15]
MRRDTLRQALGQTRSLMMRVPAQIASTLLQLPPRDPPPTETIELCRRVPDLVGDWNTQAAALHSSEHRLEVTEEKLRRMTSLAQAERDKAASLELMVKDLENKTDDVARIQDALNLITGKRKARSHLPEERPPRRARFDEAGGNGSLR